MRVSVNFRVTNAERNSATPVVLSVAHFSACRRSSVRQELAAHWGAARPTVNP